MKSFSIILSLVLAVVLVAGCAKEEPIIVRNDVQQVQDAPKELSVAEREALFEAKKKADKFYTSYEFVKND